MLLSEFINATITKLAIRTATTQPIEYVADAALRNHDRDTFILRVLKASPGARAYVKDACLASNEPGQLQLAGTLTLFETLGDHKKAAFIKAYKRAASLAINGSVVVGLGTVWEPGHTPPCPPHLPGCNEP